VIRLPLEAARRVWQARQGLSAPQKGPLADVVARTGWLRTLGGVEVYLAMRARVPALKRAELDEASQKLELQVIPAVRGCIYLVPRAHVPWALRFAESFFVKRTGRELEKAGGSWKEVEETAAVALGALGTSALTPDGLRKALPKGAIRSFGEQGKRVGLSSPLPLALRLLEFRGEIERTLEGGRLDTERYQWRRSKTSVFSGAKLPDQLPRLSARLLEIFLEQAAPVTLKDFAGWAGLSLKEASEAAALVDTAPVAVKGYAEDALVLRNQLPELERPPQSEAIALLPFDDNFTVSHGGPGVLVDPEQHAMMVPIWGSSKETRLGDATHLSYRCIVYRGRVAGFWELDDAKQRVVTTMFEALPAKAKRELEARGADTARFLLEELGHGRCFTLDTDDGVRERARKLEAMGGRAGR